MLEWAAKAAGNIWLINNANTGETYYGVWEVDGHFHGSAPKWNPLTDDGDTFRLLCFVMHWADQNVCDWEGIGFDMKCAWEELDDALASGDAERCRRAVTGLAAEIGRSKHE